MDLFESLPTCWEKRTEQAPVVVPPAPEHRGCLEIASLTSEASLEMAQEQVSKRFHLQPLPSKGHLLPR